MVDRTSSPPFDVPIAVDPADIDFMDHVNNATYLTWVQRAVIAHWRRFASAEDVARHLWIATRHEITYRKPALLGDHLVATVILDKLQGTRAFYRTCIGRGTDLLAEAQSIWCCLDAESLRPVRIGQSIRERFLSQATSADPDDHDVEQDRLQHA